MSAVSAGGHLLHQYPPAKKQAHMSKLEKHLRDNGYSYLIGSANIDVLHFYDDEERCRIVYRLNDGVQRLIEAQGPKAFITGLRARGFESVRNEDYKGPDEDAAARALMIMWNDLPPRLESQTSGGPSSADMDLSSEPSSKTASLPSSPPPGQVLPFFGISPVAASAHHSLLPQSQSPSPSQPPSALESLDAAELVFQEEKERSEKTLRDVARVSQAFEETRDQRIVFESICNDYVRKMLAKSESMARKEMLLREREKELLARHQSSLEKQERLKVEIERQCAAAEQRLKEKRARFEEEFARDEAALGTKRQRLI